MGSKRPGFVYRLRRRRDPLTLESTILFSGGKRGPKGTFEYKPLRRRFSTPYSVRPRSFLLKQDQRTGKLTERVINQDKDRRPRRYGKTGPQNPTLDIYFSDRSRMSPEKGLD